MEAWFEGVEHVTRFDTAGSHRDTVSHRVTPVSRSCHTRDTGGTRWESPCHAVQIAVARRCDSLTAGGPAAHRRANHRATPVWRPVAPWVTAAALLAATLAVAGTRSWIQISALLLEVASIR